MSNYTSPNRKKIGKTIAISAMIIIFIFLLRNKLGIVYTFSNNLTENINFRLVKVKSMIYTKLLNYKSKQHDIKYIDEYVEINKKRDAEMQKLKVQVTELNNLLYENENLRKMLSLRENNPAEYIAADVSLVEGTDIPERIFIDKGKAQGVELNLPVLYDGYLIGKISKIGENYSEVMLLTSKKSKISVIVNNKDAQILRGNGNGSFSIHNYNEPIQQNENFSIVTSGMSDIFPKGLNIGMFVIKEMNAYNQMKELSFKPSYKVFNIKNVLVYKFNKSNNSLIEIKEQLEHEIEEERNKNKGTSQNN